MKKAFKIQVKYGDYLVLEEEIYVVENIEFWETAEDIEREVRHAAEELQKNFVAGICYDWEEIEDGN